MIVAISVPDFEARVLRREVGRPDDPVAVVDESRIISVSPEASRRGLEAGELLENTEVPAAVELVQFDLEALAAANQQLRDRVQSLSPLVETIGFGEFFVEVEPGAEVEEWIREADRNGYPAAVGGAETGWLALVVARRLDPGEHRLIAPEAYENAIQEVGVEEMWGLGEEVMGILENNGIKQLGELYYLSEVERRKLLGKHSRLFHKLFNCEDPRPMSVFSRPRSLSREVSLSPDAAQDREKIIERVEPIADQLADRLQDSVSLAHRIKLGVRFAGDEELVKEHVFTVPTNDPDMFEFGVNVIISDVALTTPAQSVAVEADVIVADLENYHEEPQEVARDIEILDS